MTLLTYDFMQRALLAALLVGLAAPAVGVFLVQRRLALLGDGLGHVALTGVALGFLLGTAPVLTAVVVATLGAVGIELVRQRARTSGDVALALLFYGGIAGGVLLIGLSDGGTSATLLSYLFGSLTSVAPFDLAVIAVLSLTLLGTLAVVGRELFAVCHDEEYARVAGLPVGALNVLLAVMAAVTVTVAMRVVGLLLVSALMVVPVATAQQLVRGFRATVAVALVVGVLASLVGVGGSFYADTAPGAMIVVVALAFFAVAAAAGGLVRARGSRRAAAAVPPSRPPSRPPPRPPPPPRARTGPGDRRDRPAPRSAHDPPAHRDHRPAGPGRRLPQRAGPARPAAPRGVGGGPDDRLPRAAGPRRPRPGRRAARRRRRGRLPPLLHRRAPPPPGVPLLRTHRGGRRAGGRGLGRSGRRAARLLRRHAHPGGLRDLRPLRCGGHGRTVVEFSSSRRSPVPVSRLNHAVLYVRDTARSVAFYRDVLGFGVVGELPGGAGAFLRAPASTNDHDLAVFAVGAQAAASPAGRGAVGLYHLAWEVETLADLQETAQVLAAADALTGASDHATTKSLYARDPDGLELEVVWLVPAHLITPEVTASALSRPRPLDLEREVERYGAGTRGGLGVSVPLGVTV